MKVREVLEQHNGEMMKLGSASSYVWCGEVTDRVADILEKLSADELKRIKRVYPKLVKRAETFDKDWDSLFKKRMGAFETSALKFGLIPAVKKERKEKLIKELESNKQKAKDILYKQLEELPKRIENWTSFLERDIVEMYPSLEGRTIVIFEGKEPGKYWLYEECEL